jgi:hypothetical protein
MTQDVNGCKEPGKSGRQVGAENVEKLRGYLEELIAKGQRLPSRNGKPDKSAISLACGFDRQTFYNNAEASNLLENAVPIIGLQGCIHNDSVEEDLTDNGSADYSGEAGYLRRNVKQLEKRVQSLEGRLQAKTAEVEELRSENRALNEKLRQHEMFEEVMSTNGRRFRP